MPPAPHPVLQLPPALIEVHSQSATWETVCWASFDASAVDVVCRQVGCWVACVMGRAFTSYLPVPTCSGCVADNQGRVRTKGPPASPAAPVLPTPSPCANCCSQHPCNPMRQTNFPHSSRCGCRLCPYPTRCHMIEMCTPPRLSVSVLCCASPQAGFETTPLNPPSYMNFSTSGIPDARPNYGITTIMNCPPGASSITQCGNFTNDFERVRDWQASVSLEPRALCLWGFATAARSIMGAWPA